MNHRNFSQPLCPSHHLPSITWASSVAASQPFGHPCRAPFTLRSRCDGEGGPPPGSMKKGRPSGRNSLRKSPTHGPSDRCRLPSSGPASASLRFGPLYFPRNAALLQPPFFFRRRHAAGCTSNRLPLANGLPRPPAGQPIPLRSTGKDTPILRIRNARSPVSARANGCFYPRLWM